MYFMDHNSKSKQNFKKFLWSRANNLLLEELLEKIGTIILSEKVMPEKKILVNSIRFLLRSEFKERSRRLRGLNTQNISGYATDLWF